MYISIYLHKEVVDILECFGELDEVINKMLDCIYDSYGFSNFPACPDRENTSRYSINIRNNEYLKLYKEHGPNSPVISLRRIIYWFIYNEIYDEYNWKAIREYGEKDKQYILRKLLDIENILRKIENKCDVKVKEKVNNIGNIVNEIEGMLENDGEHN